MTFMGAEQQKMRSRYPNVMKHRLYHRSRQLRADFCSRPRLGAGYLGKQNFVRIIALLQIIVSKVMLNKI